MKSCACGLYAGLTPEPPDEHTELRRKGISLLQRLERQEAEERRLTERFQYAVREICRRSENTYYDWCCEYCCMTHYCRKDGWCNRFWPRKEPDEK